MVKVFGQELPAAFQDSNPKKEGAPWNKGADMARHKETLTTR